MFRELKEEREKYAAQIQSLQRARNESMARSFYSLQPQKCQSLSQLCSQIAEPASCNRNNSEIRVADNLDLLVESTTDMDRAYQEQPNTIVNVSHNKIPCNASIMMPPTALTDSLTEGSYSPATYNAVPGVHKPHNTSSSFSSNGTIDVSHHLAVLDQVTGLERDEEISVPAAMHTPITRHVEAVIRSVAKNTIPVYQIDYQQQQQTVTQTPNKSTEQRYPEKVDKGIMTRGARLKSVGIQAESRRTASTVPMQTFKHKRDSQRKLTVSSFVYPTREQPEIEYHPGAISNLVHPAYSSSVLQSYTEIYKSLSNTSKAILSN